MLSKAVRRIAVVVSALILVAFLVFMVNQTSQIVQLGTNIHPTFGTVLLWLLIAVYAACLLVPIALFLRLPRPLRPPESEGSPEFEAHLQALSARLRSNPHVESRGVETRQEIEAALGELDGRADGEIRRTASQVFLTTAISQNGSLDAFLVLAAQSKLVWRVAHVYHQRPALRDLVHLYANVASTAFIAGELEDIDVSAQLQPIVASALGSAMGAVPGFQAASSVLINSVMTGAANAFLTLRVGIIAKNYSNALVLPKKRELRRTAIASASGMLGSIAVEGTRKVSAAFMKASRKTVGGAITGLGSRAKDAGVSLADRVGFGRRDDPEPQEG